MAKTIPNIARVMKTQTRGMQILDSEEYLSAREWLYSRLIGLEYMSAEAAAHYESKAIERQLMAAEHSAETRAQLFDIIDGVFGQE